MEPKLEKEVRFLKIYAAIATLACAVFFFTGFAIQSKKQKFEEIDEPLGNLSAAATNGKDPFFPKPG